MALNAANFALLCHWCSHTWMTSTVCLASLSFVWTKGILHDQLFTWSIDGWKMNQLQLSGWPFHPALQKGFKLYNCPTRGQVIFTESKSTYFWKVIDLKGWFSHLGLVMESLTQATWYIMSCRSLWQSLGALKFKASEVEWMYIWINCSILRYNPLLTPYR